MGVELVSPILSTNNITHKADISRLVAAVKGEPDDKVAAFITNQCGLHVHVRAPLERDFANQTTSASQAADFAFDIKKELAIILIVYEEEIAKLHPPCRRPGHPNARYTLQSNRLGLMAEGKTTAFSDNLYNHVVNTDNATSLDVGCSTIAISNHLSIPEIRAGIAALANADSLPGLMNWPAVNSPYDKLCRQHGDRDRQANFTYINRENGANTFEFRQAKGSLDATDISCWIDFCVGLVRLARLYIEDRSRFRVKDWPDDRTTPVTTYGKEHNNINVFDLMHDMELGPAAIAYWQRRVATFHNYVTGDEHDRLEDELPPIPGRGGGGGGSGSGSDGGGDGGSGGPSRYDGGNDDDKPENGTADGKPEEGKPKDQKPKDDEKKADKPGEGIQIRTAGDKRPLDDPTPESPTKRITAEK